MVKIVVVSEGKRKDVAECERLFREKTVKISIEFSNKIYDTWGWVKQRLNLTLAEGVTPTRHHSEGRQRDYILTGAEGIWDSTSQTLFSYIREHTPIVLEKVPDMICPAPGCGNRLKIYSNKIKAVRDSWHKFWTAKQTLLDVEKSLRCEAIIDLSRNARKKFKLVPDPHKCYDKYQNLLPTYGKTIFLSELNERLNTVVESTMKSFVHVVIEGIPDLVECECRCSQCKNAITVIDS
jgi:hypothetical protein